MPFLTPADLLARGLNLPPLPTPPQPVPPGTCCAITGQPITDGYPVADVVTDATAEFLDCFRGGVDGWVSEAAARCFKSADPRRGNPCARSHLAFADGTYYGPLISRQAAQEQGRMCWSDLVRQIVPDAPVAFFDSGCEYPSTYEVVAYYGAEIIKPQMSLPEMCRFGGYWGYENPVEADAEFDFFGFLVGEPSARFVAEHGLAVLCMGLRAQESGGRRMSAQRRGELYQVESGLWHCCPLARWTHDDIWAYIASRKLRYNAVYDKMTAFGVPRRAQRVCTLLGVDGAATCGRYAYLRQMEPQIWNQLVRDFPKIARYT